MMSVSSSHLTADAAEYWAISLKPCWNEREWSFSDEVVMNEGETVLGGRDPCR
jgi:hypothetical protein